MKSSLPLLFVILALVPPLAEAAIKVAPTDHNKSLLRGGPGRFGEPRGSGSSHDGVDIVANQSSADKETYVVKAVAAGKVAYAKVNGSATTGYGYTIVIDHGSDEYTLYAHLAVAATTAVGLKVGDSVSDGQTIGYMADLKNTEKSSGNVAACVVAEYDKIQLHFEQFTAPSGRTSTGAIAPLKKDGSLLNPTSDLKGKGYGEFPPPVGTPACPGNLPPES